MSVFRLLPFAFAAVLVACSAPDSEAPLPMAGEAASLPAASRKPAITTANWQCGELAVVTRFDDEALQSMRLAHSGQELVLDSAEAEEGARFADAAGNEFWSRPGKVSLALAGKPAIECRKGG